MTLSETVTSLVLGLDIQTLTLHCSAETRLGMITLGKTTPVLLTYTAGPERQKATQAILQLLQKRARVHDVGLNDNNDDNNDNTLARSFHEQPTTVQKHFLTTRVKELPIGPRGYARVDYIPCDMVPLVDYWPDFVRRAFALGCWRFTAVGDDVKGHEKRVVVLEIMEGRLDLVEWLIEMEEKREIVIMKEAEEAGEDSARTSGRIWPVLSMSVEGGEGFETETLKNRISTEAARMMKVLRI